MAVKSFEELQNQMLKNDNTSLYDILCRNVKRLRLEKYNEFKKKNSNKVNPYSTENFAALLDYNHNHYKRFESETDSTKRIPLHKIVKISIILDVSIDDLLKP